MGEVPYDIDTVLESFQDGIYLTDRKGTTLFINSSYEKITGIGRSDVVGRNVVELERQGMFSPITNPSVVKTGKPMTVMQTSKSGRKVVVTGYPIKSAKTGDILGAITIVRDFTILEQLKQEVEYQRTLINKYREAEQLREQKDVHIIAASKQMQAIMDLAVRLARVDTPVLIQGETGVGKEVIAKILQLNSPRRDGPMLSLNCAAIPENLLESELFGYAPGAFTGANLRGKAGVFELADKGTLFLDEIGELPLQMQAKLLRVLETQEILRVGGTKVIKTNIRIITATHRNLEEMVKKGLFRRDLFYRLRVATIEIPPLRKRPEEIIPLAEYFLERYNNKYRRNIKLTRAAMDILKIYQWPGNVRELENLIQGLVVAHPHDIVDAGDLPGVLSRRIYDDLAESTLENLINTKTISLESIVNEVEKKVLIQAMKQYNRNVNEVAHALGCDRTTVQRKLKKYGIPSKRSSDIETYATPDDF